MLDKLLDFILSVLNLFRFWVVLKPYEAGVVIRLGVLKRIIGPGGLHWLLPFGVDDYVYTNIVPETTKLGPQSLTTKDQKEIVISSIAMFAVEDVEKFLLHIEGAEQVVEDATLGYISEVVRERTYNELLEMNLNAKLTSYARNRAKAFGVSIVSVQISEFTKCFAVRHLTSENHAKLGIMG